MSLFSRRARWLNALFPASVTPTITDPASRSDDVSLVQPYDGGGYPIPPVTNWFTEVTSAVAAGTQLLLLTVGDDQLFRILGCGIQRLAGNNYTRAFLQVRVPNATFLVQVSNDIGVVDNIEQGIHQLVMPICPAGSQIFMFADGGNASSQFTATLLGVSVPVGTVFSI